MPINLAQVKQYASIELLAKQMVEGFITGLHKSPYHGFSVEFAEHRLYNNGESTRHIDWKAYAKTGRLYVKRYEEETNLRCQILIDNSSSMHYPEKGMNKIGFSITAAAALSYMLQKQRDAVGVTTFSEQIEWQTPVKSTSTHIHQLMVRLEQLSEQKNIQKKTATADVIHQISNTIHRRSLVVIFSDMFENMSTQSDLFSALQHLRHNKHEVLLFHVTDQKTERDFEFEDRPYEFIDLESGEKVKVQASGVRDFYQEQMQKRYHDLKIKAGQFKIDFIEADIGQNIDQILMPYLIKRSKMK